MKKIAFITAIYGGYEKSCKDFQNQTIFADFFCFTDNKDVLVNSPWVVDTTPYHILYKSKIDNDNYTNSIKRNNHSFNIAKYYKQSFQNIPRLRDYDVIVWLDGTIEITNPNTSQYVLELIQQNQIITWNHTIRSGSLKEEVRVSMLEHKYIATFWNDQHQPYQNINYQYEQYLNSGYDDGFGVWITCFIAFANKNKTITDFLDYWYLQTLQYSTQDQVSFSYSLYAKQMLPYTLSDLMNESILNSNNRSFGITTATAINKMSDVFIKHDHDSILDVSISALINHYDTIQKKVNAISLSTYLIRYPNSWNMYSIILELHIHDIYSNFPLNNKSKSAIFVLFHEAYNLIKYKLMDEHTVTDNFNLAQAILRYLIDIQKFQNFELHFIYYFLGKSKSFLCSVSQVHVSSKGTTECRFSPETSLNKTIEKYLKTTKTSNIININSVIQMIIDTRLTNVTIINESFKLKLQESHRILDHHINHIRDLYTSHKIWKFSYLAQYNKINMTDFDTGTISTDLKAHHSDCDVNLNICS